MRLKMTKQQYPQYSKQQKWIHWLTAVFVFIVILLPIFRTSLAQYVGGMGNLFMWHKSFGVIILLLTIWRIVAIIKQGIPDVLPKHEKLQRILSKSVQGIIYLLLLILPLAGYLMSSRNIVFFDVIAIPALTLPNGLQGFFHSVHIIAGYMLIALLCLHIAGAIFHHVWLKDNVLKSMLPSRWFN